MIKFMLYILCVSCVFITRVFCQSLVVSKPTRTFEIDYETNQFLLDGKPFRYISGSVHYFRMPAIYWEDRLRKLRAAGLNTVETYVEWSQHEPFPGVYDFTGDNDLVHFIRLAEKYELLVILRPGPYICAERDLGGYPSWLFTLHPTIKLRTSDPNHKHYVKRWFDILLTNIQPLLYGNGGPIIMVQVENEYGSFYACDFAYTVWLRDLVKSYVHNNAVLFTTDGAGDNFMKCGPIPNVFITVDFGPMPTKEGVHKAFEVIRRAGQLRGPLVNSEYYTGWLTHWNENSQMVSTERVLKTLKDILDHSNNTSVNMYMFFGGSNFGFTSGANCDDGSGFRAQLTSYDYDAPISEDGDLTNKYYAIRQFLSQYVPIPPINVNNLSKANYGEVDLVPKVSLFKLMNTLPVVKHIYPVTFEELSYYSGYVMYKHKISSESILADPSQLYVPGLRDRAIVYIDQVAVGILSRFRNIFSIPLKILPGQTIYLLVENEGHINYGTFINDTKGIVCQVLLNGDPLLNWEMIQVPMKNISKIESMPNSQAAFNAPGYFSSYFQLPNDGKYAVDSYLNMDGWGKGVAFLNGINLGRYWVTTGPQLTLYVPKNMFKDYPEYNNLTIFEQEIVNPSYTASFQAEPVLDLRPPNLGKYSTKCQTKCRLLPKH